MANEEPWLSISEAAQHLGVHSRTLRRYIHDGKLTALKLSPQIVRIRKSDLGDFLKENVRVVTGTGTCYVPNPDDKPREEQAQQGRIRNIG